MGKQICFTIVWDCAEILPINVTQQFSLSFSSTQIKQIMLQKHFDSSPNSKTKNKPYDVNSNLEQQLKELSKLLKKLLCTAARKLQVPQSKNAHILSQETNKKTQTDHDSKHYTRQINENFNSRRCKNSYKNQQFNF